MENSNINTQRTRKYFSVFLSFIVVLSLNAFTQTAQGQTTYKIASGSQIAVSGTSNLHDWTMVASSFTCEGNFIMKGAQVQDISSLSFVLPVTNLKSKESLMDTRAHKALKAENFSKITFKLTEAVITPQKTIKAKGNLTIAGVSNEITIQSAYVNDDGTITLTGSKALKMSDYGMKAPSFMLGALKTGNEVTIDISLKLKRTNLIIQAINTK